MLMGYIWTGIVVLSVLYGAAAGNSAAVGAAAMEGAAAAVEFTLATGGAICLWCAVMEVMSRAGLSDALARLLRPVLRRIFPKTARDGETMRALCANVSANILGLGNAATPMGIRAAKGMAAMGKEGEASNELCTLVVLNTASIQVLPATAAAVRAAYGAAAPFDILPAVLISSAASVTVGLFVSRILSRKRR